MNWSERGLNDNDERAHSFNGRIIRDMDQAVRQMLWHFGLNPSPLGLLPPHILILHALHELVINNTAIRGELDEHSWSMDII